MVHGRILLHLVNNHLARGDIDCSEPLHDTLRFSKGQFIRIQDEVYFCPVRVLEGVF